MTIPEPAEPPAVLVSDIYVEALPEVYRYLRGRCPSRELAEELTSATFVQAAHSAMMGTVAELTVPWLITVARNKLVDHWRRQATADRSLAILEARPQTADDPWNIVLDHVRAHRVLHQLPPDYRNVLTLRYLDDLSVPECAEVLGRSVRATESLLARARRGFRTVYEDTGANDE